MKLNVNKEYSGFVVKQTDYIDEVQSEAYLLEHVYSGARLLYLGNNDDNKVFSISFRTPPYDDTGVAHILEHSVLCGSRKYKLKEPFVELVKGSMNTFLNAMTYPDKTMYPVASRNAKDFQNLMDVYLDAVFYPLIYDNPYTLLQEGWHYNIDSPEGELSYNGVVYNEMKGVFSSADALLDYEAMQALFPDTPYRFESGGHPNAIPELTQEAFEHFHTTYYSPENAFIYLYGDMDIEATLQYLNDEYLSSFKRTGAVESSIPLQMPLAKTQEVVGTYPVGSDETTEGKSYHELHIAVGDARDVKTSMALRVLESVLLEGNSAPLRLALLEAGVAKDISGSYVGSYRQPIFSIKAAGSEPGQRDKLSALSTIPCSSYLSTASTKSCWKPILTIWNSSCGKPISALILKDSSTVSALWIRGCTMATRWQGCATPKPCSSCAKASKHAITSSLSKTICWIIPIKSSLP